MKLYLKISACIFLMSTNIAMPELSLADSTDQITGHAHQESEAHIETLTSDGLGPVRVGMTLQAAEKKLGMKLIIDTDQDPSGRCAFGLREDRKGIFYMIIDNIVRRVDIEGSKESNVRTERGIRTGAKENDVRTRYKGMLEKRGTENTWSYRLIFRDPKNMAHGILFYIESGQVTWMMSGEYDALIREEDCL